MTRIHVLNMGGSIDAHRPGCKDIAKARRSLSFSGSDWIIEIPDGTDVATGVAAHLNDSFGWPYEGSDEPAPWAPSDIHVLPCTRRPS